MLQRAPLSSGLCNRLLSAGDGCLFSVNFSENVPRVEKSEPDQIWHRREAERRLRPAAL